MRGSGPYFKDNDLTVTLTLTPPDNKAQWEVRNGTSWERFLGAPKSVEVTLRADPVPSHWSSVSMPLRLADFNGDQTVNQPLDMKISSTHGGVAVNTPISATVVAYGGGLQLPQLAPLERGPRLGQPALPESGIFPHAPLMHTLTLDVMGPLTVREAVQISSDRRSGPET